MLPTADATNVAQTDVAQENAALSRFAGLVASKSWPAARRAAETALERFPHRPEAHVLAGCVALFGDNDAERAAAMTDEILARWPDSDHALDLAGYARRALGDDAGALASAQGRLALNPGRHRAYLDLARCAPSKAAPHRAAIEALIANTAPHGDDAASLWAALGAVYEHEARFDEAYAAFQKSKLARPDQYHPDAETRRAAACQAIFTREMIETLTVDGFDDARMVFLCGMPRSGEALVERALTAHPSIASCGERPELATILGDMLGRVPSSVDGDPMIDPLLKLLQMSPSDRAGIARRYLDAVAPCVRGDGATRWIDATPTNFLHCGAIGLLFPKATVIGLRRDPRDIALSTHATFFNEPKSYMQTPDRCAHLYMIQREYMRHWRAALGDRFVELRYEDMVADPETATRGLVEQIGLAWDPACASATLNDARDPVGRWRDYAENMAGVVSALDQYEAARDDA